MSRPEPRRSDELPISNAAIAGIVVAILVVGTAAGFVAFMLFGNAEEAPDAEFEVTQYGASDQQVAITNLSGERIEDPGTVVVTVRGERVQNNTGYDWANSENGIGPDSAVYVGYNDSGGYVIADAPDHPSLDRGLPPGSEIKVLWISDEADSSALLADYEVERRDS
jgi:hypothetical protein